MSIVRHGWRDPHVAPHDPVMAAPRPDLFAALTPRENITLRQQLASGLDKQTQAYPVLAEPSRETGAVLDDLADAFGPALDAERAAARPEPLL
jgi:hypothetical protein